MTRPVIAVADTAFADHAGLEKDFNDHAELRWIDLSRPDTVRESTGDADAVVVTLQRLSDDVITAFAPSVRVIGRAGVGLDTIDLTTAEKRGIAVINQPAYAAAEVATHALALLLALERRLSPSDAFVRPAGAARWTSAGSGRWTMPLWAWSAVAGSARPSSNGSGHWSGRWWSTTRRRSACRRGWNGRLTCRTCCGAATC